MSTLFSIQHLGRTFQMHGKSLHVLNDLSFDIEEGKWTAITGRSGSGKTTLLQLIGTLDRPTSGSIFYKNQNLNELSNSQLSDIRRRDFGYIFQSYHLMPELTAIENVALPGLSWFKNRDIIFKEAEELLCRFGLGHRLKHRPQELSGGEQQRIAMARALINHPKVILADEPTGNLDKSSATQLMEYLLQVRKENNFSIIMVTHDSDIANLADIRIDMNSLIANTEPSNI